ncbi:alpha/beta fold hydrolase [Actinomycetospora termitidis]|uniref:Alpha/beta hydrolase n=1 Tax=Actinomycetospora termitidis TaxID=3053470 RepID=A0ABT7M627_9PSEU|nr:alpha/beta hydrolase [Actinomycetospora sp. Odt1-22]MDL5156109.1 alpha/beta hydrolase [Actinomycetospora sp. Odt1-22]
MSHSFAFARREWTEAAELLSARYRTVALDMPGFGEAADDTDGLSIELMCRRVADTIRELELTRYVLVGHSMTGKVMQILAGHAGKDLGLSEPPEKTVLITPTPLGTEVGGTEFRRELREMPLDRADAEAFVDARVATPITDEQRRRTVEDFLATSRTAWEWWLDSGTYEDWVERAAPVETEALVVVADLDPTWGLEMQTELTLPHLAHHRVVTVACGHSVPLEAPRRLAELITEFVEQG